MENDFIPLPIRFEQNGFLYWQICRTDKAAIYEQYAQDRRVIFYEVWKIRKRDARIWQGRSFPAGERGPSTNEWGKYGWTFFTMVRARAKFDELNGLANMSGDNKTAGNGLPAPKEVHI